MYSGTTLTKYSGRIIGAHQKIDRTARRHLSRLLIDDNLFPKARMILQFEGKNGPDAIKHKSPAKDEPWHFYSPFDDDDSQLIELINDHYIELVKQLKKENKERAAFEAAWLAHAIVDGLTPAHHYPYEKKLTELRGEGIESRTTIKNRLVLPGETRRAQVKNNWKMWGPKGLFTTHGLFEMGLATIFAPLSFNDAIPKEEDINEALKVGITELFKRRAREIAVLDIYETYYKKGWTSKLAYDMRHKLGPTIVKTVTLAWYLALVEAGIIEAAHNYENNKRSTRRNTVR
jgi:hypothetical protein